MRINVEIAKLCGANAAAVADYIWHGSYVEDGDKELKVHDGYLWAKCKQKTISDGVKFLSVDGVSSAVRRLVCEGIIKMKSLSDDKFDHTYWYTFTEYGKKLMLDVDEEEYKEWCCICEYCI